VQKRSIKKTTNALTDTKEITFQNR